MAKSIPNHNIICLLFVYFLMLQVCQIVISLEINYRNNESFENDNNQDLMTSIKKWWQGNNLTKPLDCKYKAIPIYTANKLFNMISAPEIKSFPCSGGDVTPHFYFKGIIRDGYLEGKGKLVFINETEWLSLSPSDVRRKEVMAYSGFNVCFKASDFQGRGIKEIVGTFKNGSLHGLAKVTYMDNAFSIGSYKNGKAHGYRRVFDSKSSLIDAGGYEIGWEAGCHWKLRFGNLLYQDREMINDNVTPMIVFPIGENGNMQEPIAGDYFQQSCALENIYKVQLISILSSNSSCLLNIRYKLSEKENYTYSLCSKTRYPLFGQNEHNLLCNINREYKIESAPRKLENWFKSMNKLLDVQSIQDGYYIHSPLEVLWQLKPESERLNENMSTRLLADVNLNIEEKTMTARVLGSPPVKILFSAGDIKLDNDLKLNGFNDIIIESEYQKLVPRDSTLGWSPTRIIGNFDHGNLNGFAFLQTNVSTFVWAMMKNGIMHGPCVIWGISYIIEPVSFILQLNFPYTEQHINIISFVTYILSNFFDVL